MVPPENTTPKKPDNGNQQSNKGRYGEDGQIPQSETQQSETEQVDTEPSETQQLEPQQSEAEQSETQPPQSPQSETEQADTEPSETQQPETQQSEAEQRETQPPESPQSETEQADTEPPETQQPQTSGFFNRLLKGKKQDREDQEAALRETVTISEVVALVHYVVETGQSSACQIAKSINLLLFQYTHTSNRQQKAKIHTQILEHYCCLTALTYADGGNVNGRTLKSSQRTIFDLWFVVICGALSFILAAGTQIAGNYYDLRPPPAGYNFFSPYGIYQHVMVYLLPAFWGALGATIYLTMNIAGHSAKNTFDSRKLRGQLSRIGLGAVFGAVVVHLFFNTIVVSSLEDIGPSAVAFLTGLGVKAVYGAFAVAVNRITSAIRSLEKKPEPKPVPNPNPPGDGGRQ